MRFLAIALFLGLATLPAAAGTLRLGPPVVSNDQYRFPVYLQGDAEGVAALDFRLAYDPAVFSPVSAQSGPSAASAQKQVSSNVASPGEFVVVMMGFNQNSVAPGQVVEIVLEKRGDPSNGRSILRIAEPTMATADGSEISSRGLARTVEFGHGKDEENEGREERADGEADADEPPADPDERDLTPPEAPSSPRGTVPFVIAGRDGAEGGFSGRMPVGGGAPVPAAARGGTGENSASAAPDGPAPVLPGGEGGQADGSPGAGTGAPGGDSNGGQPTGEVPAVSAAPDAPSPALAAAIQDGEAPVEGAATGGSDSSGRRTIGILLILGLAPVGLFVVYKGLGR